MAPQTVEQFHKLVSEIEQSPTYQRPLAFGLGLTTLSCKGEALDCFYPAPQYQTAFGAAAILAKIVGYKSGTHSYVLSRDQLAEAFAYMSPFLNDKEKKHVNLETIQAFLALSQSPSFRKQFVVTFIAVNEQDPGPQGVADAYLRLHLLSHRLVRPHGIKIQGLFKVLPNVAWTSEGPLAIEELAVFRQESLLTGKALNIHSVDKFPRMTDYVVPSGVRIADASRVRLGAYLGEGTTVMHEGFVNFNAGCEGPNMIEGRISAGVFVKKGSDLGGGCSTMGTLSGGGELVISIGEDCLIGANGGVGIPLGDRCTVESGLYITAGTKLAFQGKTVKARDLAGKNDLLFRRHSLNGSVEAIVKGNTLSLNSDLHKN